MLGKKRKSRTTWTKELINDTIRNRHIECVMYSGNTSLSKSDFICTKPGCGYTWSTVLNHVMRGTGCARCSNKEPIKTKEAANARLVAIGSEYICIEYGNGTNKQSTFYHEKCGYTWSTSLISVISGRGCARCSKNEPIKTKERANIKLIAIGSDYICIDYGKNVRSPSMFYHESCGCKWSTTLDNIIRGSGCPSCAASKGEKAVREYLSNKRIQFEEQYSPSWIGRKRYDFYLPTHNLIIEFHGIQHYEYIPFFHRSMRAFRSSQKDDAFKEAEAKKNGIRHLIIPYTDICNIARLIDRLL